MNSRPASSRPQIRINPITGEEMPYSSWKGDMSQNQTPRETPRQTSTDTARQTYREMPRHHGQQQPSIVPPLNLSRLVGRDEDDYTFAFDNSKLSPSSASTISWGTATAKPAYKPNAQHILMADKDETREGRRDQKMAPKAKQLTAWDRVPVPENIPPPSQRQMEWYRQMEEERRNAYQQKVAPVALADVDRMIEQMKFAFPLKGDRTPEEDDDKDTMQRGWTQAPYSKEALRKIQDREDLEEEKRKSKMLETVLIDQLCRPVISDPKQNNPQSARATPAYHPGMKRCSTRALHDSRIKTDGTPTENLLSRRVRFDARVLTTNGRDAIRELSGFFFAVDNSLTIYEYRRLGKSSKALPFIKRGSYLRPQGLRLSDPYTLVDIKQGSDLCFECDGQPLPDSLKDLNYVTIRVTDVDNEAKKAILLSEVVGREREEMWKTLHLPESKEEHAAQLLKEDVQRIVGKQIQKRALRVYTGLGHLFRQASRHDKEKVNKYELEKGLMDFHIEVPEEKADDLWDVLDLDKSSFLPYADFLRAFLGEMNEDRKIYVLKAFSKIDSAKQGVVTVGEMSKFYNAHKHPKVKSGECSEEEILEMFLASFKESQVKGHVSYREFEEYYEGLSVGIESDSDFINILKNAWNV